MLLEKSSTVVFYDDSVVTVAVSIILHSLSTGMHTSICQTYAFTVGTVL